MRSRFLSLNLFDQQELLYHCAWLSWADIQSGIISPGQQLQAALDYGSKYGILQSDYSTIYATVFPTNGPPQKP